MTNRPPRWRRSVMDWLLLVAAVAIGIPAAAWLAQERLIFFPQPLGSTGHLPPHAKPFSLHGADGAQLRGWIAEGSEQPAPAVIYFGGNAEEVSWTLADARWPRRWSIVAVNYRGYGASDGKPGERELEADALALYDFVAADAGVDRSRIVVFGRSLGTAVATHVAAHRPVAGVVLVSPYDSVVALGNHHYPWLPVSLLLRHRFDAQRDARECRTPLLAIVAPRDAIIPLARSRALYDAWAGPKRWHEVPEADHNSLGASSDYWSAGSRFRGRARVDSRRRCRGYARRTSSASVVAQASRTIAPAEAASALRTGRASAKRGPARAHVTRRAAARGPTC